MRRCFQLTALLGAALALASGGCGNQNTSGKNLLSGTVKADGQLVPDVPLVVTGPDGKTAGGMTDPKGEYIIPDPPQGKLQFHFMPAGPSAKLIPKKYTKTGNGLEFDYTGGKQTYNVEMSK
jgi:hypothetical protein